LSILARLHHSLTVYSWGSEISSWGPSSSTSPRGSSLILVFLGSGSINRSLRLLDIFIRFALLGGVARLIDNRTLNSLDSSY
jgi:hypothetical protein